MKKILFASTALIATAGIASAEFAVSGSGRVGVVYTDDATADHSTRIEQRMRVNFTGIAETDAGVKVEARIRLEANEAGADKNFNSISGKGPGAAGFAVSYEGLRLDIGNVSDVIDSGDHFSFGGTGVGFTGFIEQNNGHGIPTNGFGAGGSDYTTVKVLYTVSDFSVSASYHVTDGSTAATTGGASTHGDSEWQVGAGYNFGTISVGAAVGSTSRGVGSSLTDNDFWAAGLSGSAGAFSYNVLVHDADTYADVGYGFSGAYAVSSATAIQFAFADGANNTDAAFGIGASHDLGGGVTLAGGLGSNKSGNTQADMGIKFGF